MYLMPKILVVDDHEMAGKAATRTVGRAGYETRLVLDPQGALNLIEQGEYKPELILCDMMMPGMTGLDLLRKLRERGDKTPLIFLSGQMDDDLEDRIQEAIANDVAQGFLRKPWDPDDLLPKIRSLIGR